ncbi:hypothetical protein [Fastidiosibacter lacustris]|uniref:hypothetical protein n=1 Tax=Fastidiosibacter lacustris TaxID=2056695 RepID=UPI0013005476|nr:hypothetical protein [Fastidiosibacter lacustris]
MPSKKIERNDQWSSFDSIQQVYDKVTPNKTSVNELKNMGFDPYAANNVKIENYLDTRIRFDPLSTGKNIPAPVAKCLSMFKHCQAYVVNVDYDYEKRIGNVFLDLTSFRRETMKEGWGFQAVFIIQDELVVYKLWSGEPKRKAYIDEIRPLGPLQSLDDLITGAAISF